MDTMEITKIVGSLCAALLVLMLGSWAAETLYHVGGGGHGHSEAAYIIEVEEGGAAEAVDEGPTVAELIAVADLGKGEKLFGKCKACHKPEEGANGTGPYLYGIVGRDVGSVDGFGYSGTLAELPGDWTAEQLDGFLANPKKFAPGTTMGFAGLKKATDRANLIAWLDSLDD